MHSTEFKELAQLMDEAGEVVLGFIPATNFANIIRVLSYFEDMERLYVYPDMMRMQYRDGTFMQWAPRQRIWFATYDLARTKLIA